MAKSDVSLKQAAAVRDAALKALENHKPGSPQEEFDKKRKAYHQAQAVHHKLTRQNLNLPDSYQPMYDVFLDFLHEDDEDVRNRETWAERRKRIARGVLRARKTPTRTQLRREYQIKKGLIDPDDK